jgi:hypothetical protein
MTTPDERAFVTFPRGQVRDEMLSFFRNGLRQLKDPETGLVFTEEDVRLATQPGSRIYIEFDAIDLFGQAAQTRARFTAQQADPRRATSSWLRAYWVPLWLPDGPLPASPGVGPVRWQAPVGALFIGSTTPGDPTAFQATDPAGNVYQLFTTVMTPGNGLAELTMFAVAGGDATNPRQDTVFKVSANAPLGAATSGTVTSDFAGGFDPESDDDLVLRLLDVIARRPASGNNAQFRAWARAASNAIENAWVYATALNSGSTIIAITQKRGDATGPLARIASDVTLATARGFLTPPGSPVVPGRPFVLVHKCVSDPIVVSAQLSMRKGTDGGWADAVPWPNPVVDAPDSNRGVCRIEVYSSQTSFKIFSRVSLPNGATSLSGANAPRLMAWNSDASEFEKLDVASVTFFSGQLYTVALNVAPSFTVAEGTVVCPFSELAVSSSGQGLIPKAMQDYFDALGPGEVVDIENDPRGARAYRWPSPNEESPSEAGQLGISFLTDALGAALSSGTFTFVSHSIPALPTALDSQGPSLITLNEFGVYSP